MNIKEEKNGIRLNIPFFSLSDTLNCGQCFRWETDDNITFTGFHNGHFLKVSEIKKSHSYEEAEIFFHDITKKDFDEIWKDYFDFDTDYESMQKIFKKDKTLSLACNYAGGIRILKQEPWETICSFIISQNNNIPRIKGIISRLCENFGEKTKNGYLFPTAKKIASLSIEDLAPLRAGFRAKYINDAATKIANNEISISEISTLPIEEARNLLQTIKGVGPKVCECALLFGFYKLDAFPIDTWIKKVLLTYYPDGFPEYATKNGGVAQQYLFHYIRNNPPKN